MTIDFYRQLAVILQTEPVVVATVVRVSGSVPREVGAKMMIWSAGQAFGTIGGGAGEAKVCQSAKATLASGESQLVKIDLSGTPQRENPQPEICPWETEEICSRGMGGWGNGAMEGTPQQKKQGETQGICGGKMQVWLARWGGESAIALTHDILHVLENGQFITLITPFDQTRSPYLSIAMPAEQSDCLAPASPLLPSPVPVPPSPPLPPPVRQTVPLSHREAFTAEAHSPLPDSFSELLLPPPTLLIIGAGHCGIQLANVAHLAGFQVMVQDDRPEWANPDHYPQATQIFTASIRAAIAHLATNTQLYAALVTRGYQYDLEALQALLQRDQPCQYIGMIGSRKRVQQVYQALMNTGISKNQLQSIHAPIGLDIGALTPEEIAVSICAELILVRRGGTGFPLSLI